MSCFFKFIGVGIVNTLFDIGVFTALIHIFGTQNIVIFNILSYSTGIVCSFILNSRFTFKDTNLTFSKFSKLYLSSSFGMVLNTSIMFVLIKIFGVNIILSKIFATLIVVVYNYIICKNYIFEHLS